MSVRCVVSGRPLPILCQSLSALDSAFKGEGLDERLARGPIALDDALPIARQIAEALEAADERGITHRDLKPSNIRVTSDGRVKVLDFGLAKAFQEQVSTPLSNSPTLMSPSVPGVILGTAAYMSPEQAKGKEVDSRTDVFAFGVVLYEMLTGSRLFAGETVGEILAAVFKDAPDWSRLPAETPEGIRRLLRRCLQKDRRQRLQYIGDARIELEELFAPSDTTVARPIVAVPAPRRERAAWVMAGLATVSAIVLAGLVVANIRTPVDAPAVRFLMPAPDGTTFMSGVTGGFGHTVGRVSPDGRHVAFTARDESGRLTLWVRSLDSVAARSLPGTEGAGLPFWSPDSRSIGFFTLTELKRIGLDGGSLQTLCDVRSGRGGTWSADDVILFGRLNGSVSRVSATGGEAAVVTEVGPGQKEHRYPSFLPDGKHFLYYVQPSDEGSEEENVFVGTLGPPADARRLLSADSQAVYAAQGSQGYVLFVRQSTLLAQPFDAGRLALGGEPIPIAEQVFYETTAGVGAFSVSDNGVLVYRTGLGGPNQDQLGWVDRAGKLIETVGDKGDYGGLDVSPDGKSLALHRLEPRGTDIWTSSGTTLSRLTFDASQENSSPVWSPDGRHVVFVSRRNERWGVYRKRSDGSGKDELLDESNLAKAPASWSPDGNTILSVVLDPKTGSDIWAIPAAAGRATFPVLQTPANEGHPQLSPDGRWMAYTSNVTGTSQVYIESFPPGAGKWQVSTNGGQRPRWRADGRELFFLDGEINFRRMVSVDVTIRSATLEFSVARPLFEAGRIETTNAIVAFSNVYAVSPDGQRFLLPRVNTNVAGELTTTPLTVVLNWPAALRR